MLLDKHTGNTHLSMSVCLCVQIHVCACVEERERKMNEYISSACVRVCSVFEYGVE